MKRLSLVVILEECLRNRSCNGIIIFLRQHSIIITLWCHMINFHRICTHLSVWEGESGFRMGVTVEGEEANRGGQRIEGRVNGWERMLWCQTFIFKTTNYQNVPEIFSVSEHLIMNYPKSINSSHRQCLPSYKSDMFIIHAE